ncbi:MAG: polysaccharide export protein [Alphaproteobacteria bacterium]|nr:polysaccharide export protein [Alphaproteobacteria bacterium]
MRRFNIGIASITTVAALSFAAILAFSAAASAQSGPGNPALPTYNPALPTPQGLPSHPSQNLASTQPANQPIANDSSYRLGPGDQLHITVFGQQDMTNNYQIDGAGMLAFPLIGRVHAGGLTAAQLQQTITSKLSPDYIRHPSVSVEVLNYRPFYILGEVNKPGAYPYVSGMTVINAAALAGGFTYRAKDDNFHIKRVEGGKHVELDAGDDTPVRPGDVITIPERFF